MPIFKDGIQEVVGSIPSSSTTIFSGKDRFACKRTGPFLFVVNLSVVMLFKITGQYLFA